MVRQEWSELLGESGIVSRLLNCVEIPVEDAWVKKIWEYLVALPVSFLCLTRVL